MTKITEEEALTAKKAYEITDNIAKDLIAYMYMPKQFRKKNWRSDMRAKKEKLVKLAHLFVYSQNIMCGIDDEYDIMLAQDRTDVEPIDWYVDGEDNFHD